MGNYGRALIIGNAKDLYHQPYQGFWLQAPNSKQETKQVGDAKTQALRP